MHGVIFNLDLVTAWDFVVKYDGNYIPTASPYRVNCDILYETIDLDNYTGEADPRLKEDIEDLQTQMLAFIFGIDDYDDIEECQKYLDSFELLNLSRYEQKCIIGAYRAQYRKEQNDPLWANDLVNFSIIKQAAPTHTHNPDPDNKSKTAEAAAAHLPPGQVIGRAQPASTTTSADETSNTK